MSPHQALALGVRLFVVWFALTTVGELFAYFGNWRARDGFDMLGFVIAGTVVTFVVLLALWNVGSISVGPPDVPDS